MMTPENVKLLLILVGFFMAFFFGLRVGAPKEEERGLRLEDIKLQDRPPPTRPPRKPGKVEPTTAAPCFTCEHFRTTGTSSTTLPELLGRGRACSYGLVDGWENGYPLTTTMIETGCKLHRPRKERRRDLIAVKT